MSQLQRPHELDWTSVGAFNPTRLSNRAFGIQPIAANARRPNGPIRRRRIIYIAGYDPRGPEEAARRILEREIARMCQRTGISAEITPVADGPSAHQSNWSVHAHSPKDAEKPWSVTSDFLYLRWDDLVAPDFARRYPVRLVGSLGVFADYVISGALFRMARTSHSTVFLWLYPPIAVLLLLLVALLGGTWAQSIAGSAFAIGASVSGLIGMLCAVAIMATGSAAMPLGYWGHLMELWIFCRDYAVGNRGDVEERCRYFAQTIAETVARDDADETIIVGHSCGCLLTMEAVGAALIETPDAFAKGTPALICNVGSCAGASLLRHTSETTRARVRALAETPNLIWLEIQAKQDLINSFQADPAVMAGLDDDPSRPNPIIRTLNVKGLVTPATYRRIRKDFFRNHHQTIMANDYEQTWEFPREVCQTRPFADIAWAMVAKYMIRSGQQR